ncbi:CoA transferase [Phytohabitans sp. ZYX-F-186]|uniref:CoA transferase n=1 Tax=Phytohabitans maris TaxID=3071409 RepID=A0ABU0ZKJ9_9ACTN|nr:CoA transferase [Phytohabitans sp. ZYX-F-186]MDQ7907508.1 CoA transferase [Phytohabitans sp. ZYX-F-186]
MPGWEGVIAAATGNCRPRRDEAPDDWDWSRPSYSALPLAANFAAFLGCLAIVAALTERHGTGRGERIEAPLFNATFELIGVAGAYPVERGRPPEKRRDPNGSGTYRCADGRHVRFDPIGGSMRFMSWFLDAAGRSSWIGEGFTSRQRLAADPTLAAELRARLTTLFLQRPAREWEDLANAAGVPLCMVRTAAEWTRTDHARETRAVVRLDDPLLGPTWMPGRPIRLSAHEAPLRPRHLPDADRAAILAALDAPPPRRPATRPATGAPPYTGKRVIDLTQVLAGPTAGRLLGEFGAEVIKINSPQRRVDAHGYVNRGKRTMLVDVESARGQEEVLWPLVREADVLLQNFPRATAERYGTGYEHVRPHRPDIVYVSVSCYGDGGPWESRRGYETQGQAATGIVERAGRGRRPMVQGPYNVLDYGTGAVAALGAALAIYHQVVRGEGLRVSTSLAQVGTLHQATLIVEPEAGPLPGVEPAGLWALGAGPLQRFYPAADGWFYLGAAPDDLPSLAAVDGLAAISGRTADALVAALEAAFATGTVATWVDRLRAAGLGAHRVVELAELMVDPAVRAQGLSMTQVSDEAGAVVMPGTAVTLESRSLRAGRPAPRPGSDAVAVLGEMGLAPGRIDGLARAWVVQLDDLPPGWHT